MSDLCSRCNCPVEDYASDWSLHEPLCVECWFEQHKENGDIDD